MASIDRHGNARRPPGTPHGGRFAERPNTAPSGSLGGGAAHVDGMDNVQPMTLQDLAAGDTVYLTMSRGHNDEVSRTSVVRVTKTQAVILDRGKERKFRLDSGYEVGVNRGGYQLPDKIEIPSPHVEKRHADSRARKVASRISYVAGKFTPGDTEQRDELLELLRQFERITSEPDQTES